MHTPRDSTNRSLDTASGQELPAMLAQFSHILADPVTGGPLTVRGRSLVGESASQRFGMTDG
ncbi:MAG: hypothetical protein M3150_09090, partial [Pseudomonadota bacterium]|nr:hypothetical protein [Pseudomonadota bacterium]